MTVPAVDIRDLEFSYPGQSGAHFSKLNLKIEENERFGLFGPNGAGKTTLMNLMTGLLIPTGGSIFLFGKKLQPHDRTIKTLFGLVPQDFSFYQELSPVENMEFFGAWAGLKRAEIRTRISELMHVLGLTEVQDNPVRTYSGGMKRRVNLAIAVMHRPKILFLDEPTVGVDVQTRYAIINYLRLLNEEGTTLLYTSHQLNEAEALCRKIALIDEGRIIVNDQLENLLIKHGQDGLEGLFLNLTGKAYRD
jgi:ABC-2 type transport system ATP-binding protein